MAQLRNSETDENGTRPQRSERGDKLRTETGRTKQFSDGHRSKPEHRRSTGNGKASRFLQSALELARRGWQVFPVREPDSHGGCSCPLGSRCSNTGKHPYVIGGFHAATTDEGQIREWAARWPDANVGVRTGLNSRLLVLDVDGEEGQKSLERLQSNERLPKTLCVLTGRIGADGKRAGYHLYFRLPSATNWTHYVKSLGPGLDIKCEGGYVVGSRSLHASGLTYEFRDGKVRVATAPNFLIQLVQKDRPIAQRNLPSAKLNEGERNTSLFNRAFRPIREGATFEETKQQVHIDNARLCNPRLLEGEVVAIATNAWKASKANVPRPERLEIALERVRAENHATTYEAFKSLIGHLDSLTENHRILLPEVRIAGGLGCHHSLIGRHRRRAERDGLICEVQPYIAQKRATVYSVLPAGRTL